MPLNVSQKLIQSHLFEEQPHSDGEIALRIDQTLTQDATGTLVMLELETMGIDRVRTEISAQYVDHNLLQEDYKNPDDHLFLLSACRRFGIWYSRPGNGVSHPLHQERFGRPGKTLLGSDSHTPAAGAIGMLAIGAGGLQVALAMAGQPYSLRTPKIWGVQLEGELPDWVSAKDIVLEMLRRHDVDGAVGYIVEYYGPGLRGLSIMDRHVIANMGTELGATTTVFPSDKEVQRFLIAQGRGDDWQEITADPDCDYDRQETIDLSQLEPLIAMPSSPGNVRLVSEVAGRPIYQSYIGSSANPGYRDFAMAAEIVRDRCIADGVSLDINPTSRQILGDLTADGHVAALIHAGARLHQAGCNGCIGMGQAPATGQLSLRTVPRNFPGRSGTRDDQVCLVSPETAAASALMGQITDPRTLDQPYPRVREPEHPTINTRLFVAPLSTEECRNIELVKGPNIQSLPTFDLLPDRLEIPVLLKMGDNISTDEIMPAGARILPYRSNIPKISEFAYEIVDDTYAERAAKVRSNGGHVVIAGENYGQGSSREHAALAPRYLGLRVVIAKSFARIHQQNLVDFGILPLLFADGSDFESLCVQDTLVFSDLDHLSPGKIVSIRHGDQSFQVRHELSSREIKVIRTGGLINWMKARS